ncbi:uncharacterized protein LOC108147089 [Drosophila elegans]|uniref:uncharacterized protein LOC108147089 n=1 Tax=Drosophila elegans TaxID=30023 RepID=UPI0007E6D2B2|nr:uncharacterized protein LOC108147089 [Drosophila elegans]
MKFPLKGPTARLIYGGVLRQPCFGAQLKRNQSQKSPKTTAAQRSPCSRYSPSCDGLTHLPGQRRQPSWQRRLACHINQP